MSITKIKNNFHSLIENAEDTEILKYFYDAFSYTIKNNWKISEKEKKQIMEAYEESEDEKNLIKHQTVMKKHLKWLSK